jgi:predicted acyl esterase
MRIDEIPVRDGTIIAAAVYRPESGGPFPALHDAAYPSALVLPVDRQRM